MKTLYKNPKDKNLLKECEMLPSGTVPSKIWSPEGTYFVSICTTHEEIAGSLVADGMPESDYWPTVIQGYRSTVRWYGSTVRRYQDRERSRMEKEYAQGWVGRWLEYHLADTGTH